MAAIMACIGGEEVHRQWDAGRITGDRIGPRKTPFGLSGDVFLVNSSDPSFYLLSRYGAGMAKTSPASVNNRANMYALKDLGVQDVVGWGPGGAITHSIAVGDLVILSDLIDRTHLRTGTFFEQSPLGYLRQFPVFCPQLRETIGKVLNELKLAHHTSGTAVVCEGPRLETPAEVRMLGSLGAQVVTHTFVPEAFLAKELQLCYAGVCYVVNYAETGSRHRPFAASDLFGGLTQTSDAERLAGVMGAMTDIVRNVAQVRAEGARGCECDKTMAANVREYNLPADWREWFT